MIPTALKTARSSEKPRTTAKQATVPAQKIDAEKSAQTQNARNSATLLRTALRKPKVRTAKIARLEMRTTPEQRVLIDRAAAYSGRSVTDFVLASVQEAAVRTIQDHEIIRLTAKDSLVFARALLNPRAPSASLLKAAKTYKKIVGR